MANNLKYSTAAKNGIALRAAEVARKTQEQDDDVSVLMLAGW